MAFHHQGSGSAFPSFSQPSISRSPPGPSAGTRASGPKMNPSSPFHPLQESFDILEWYPQFQSCVRYFLDYAQHEGPVQAIAAFVNIQLPFQRFQNPIVTSKTAGSPPAVPSPSATAAGKFPMPALSPTTVSLTPYVRRLVATGFDFPGVLHGFFGDDWARGIGHMHEVERRNYMFASKSSYWLDVKSQYDMPDGQTIPFLRPLQNVTLEEIDAANESWSKWMAMQDWMLGPEDPENLPPMEIKSEE
ncbi:hypothetical protein F5Y15DRAFT_310219 [Xylariaceae sp. FL0016]|nr:hypothetical protein F5Y15DRAFT_310219 [Xylariaceae sp. FL0016]